MNFPNSKILESLISSMSPGQKYFYSKFRSLVGMEGSKFYYAKRLAEKHGLIGYQNGFYFLTKDGEEYRNQLFSRISILQRIFGKKISQNFKKIKRSVQRKIESAQKYGLDPTKLYTITDKGIEYLGNLEKTLRCDSSLLGRMSGMRRRKEEYKLTVLKCLLEEGSADLLELSYRINKRGKIFYNKWLKNMVDSGLLYQEVKKTDN